MADFVKSNKKVLGGTHFPIPIFSKYGPKIIQALNFIGGFSYSHQQVYKLKGSDQTISSTTYATVLPFDIKIFSSVKANAHIYFECLQLVNTSGELRLRIDVDGTNEKTIKFTGSHNSVIPISHFIDMKKFTEYNIKLQSRVTAGSSYDILTDTSMYVKITPSVARK